MKYYTYDAAAIVVSFDTFDADGITLGTFGGTPTVGIRHRRAGVLARQPVVAIGSTDASELEIADAFFYGIAGTPYTGPVATGAGELDLTAQTIPQNTWGVYLLSVDAAGDYTVTPGTANATTGYASEAAALAAIPATPAGEFAVCVITVHAQNDPAGFVAATDDLDGATQQAVNFYPLKSAGGDAITLRVDENSEEGINSALVNGPLLGVCPDDELEVDALTGTVDSVNLRGVVGEAVGITGDLDADNRLPSAAAKARMDAREAIGLTVTVGAGSHTGSSCLASDQASKALDGKFGLVMAGANAGRGIKFLSDTDGSGAFTYADFNGDAFATALAEGDTIQTF